MIEPMNGPPPAAMNDPSMLVITSAPEAIKSARDFARGWFHARGYRRDAVYVALLVVSELVTNAHKHGAKPGEPISIRLYLSESGPVVEVRDRGEREPRVLPLTFDRPCGRGLAMVSELTDALGFRRLASGGKAVYAVMKKEPA